MGTPGKAWGMPAAGRGSPGEPRLPVSAATQGSRRATVTQSSGSSDRAMGRRHRGLAEPGAQGSRGGSAALPRRPAWPRPVFPFRFRFRHRGDREGRTALPGWGARGEGEDAVLGREGAKGVQYPGGDSVPEGGCNTGGRRG